MFQAEHNNNSNNSDDDKSIRILNELFCQRERERERERVGHTRMKAVVVCV